jgi:HlyD family secretion protein
MSRKIWIGVIIVAAVAGGITLWTRGATGPSETKDPEAGTLQHQAVTRGDLETLVSSTGTLVAVGTVDIGTQVSGTIDRVLVDFNDRVSRDQVLAVLDLSLFEAAVDEARAGLIQAQARLKQARAELTRNRTLFESGNLSAQEYLDLETTVELNRAGALSAEATLNRARSNLDNATIRSPIDGTVITRNIEAGQTVAASYSTPTLFVIAEDLSRMQIEADVDESDIGLIRQDQRVRFTVQAYPDEVFDGVVTQIRLNPKTVSNVVTYTVMVDADNREGRLLPGMTATTDFVVARADAVLLVPNAALRFRPEPVSRTDSGAAVYVLGKGGNLSRITVTPGISDGNVTAVADDAGLAEGMNIITGRTLEKNTAKKGLLSRLTPPRPGHPRR